MAAKSRCPPASLTQNGWPSYRTVFRCCATRYGGRGQEFYKEHLEEHKRGRYLELAKKRGVAEHKVEAALEKKNKAVALRVFLSLLGTAFGVYLRRHRFGEGLDGGDGELLSLRCRGTRCLRCSVGTTTCFWLDGCHPSRWTLLLRRNVRHLGKTCILNFVSEAALRTIAEEFNLVDCSQSEKLEEP